MGLDVSEQGAALQLLRLESMLPFERLRPCFLERRRALWQQELLRAQEYSVVLCKLQELKEAILEPTTRVRLAQVLRGIPIPQRTLPFPGSLVDLMVNFTYAPVSEIVGKVDPGQGWESGNLDLAALQRQARREAARLPTVLRQRETARGSSAAIILGRPAQTSWKNVSTAV